MGSHRRRLSAPAVLYYQVFFSYSLFPLYFSGIIEIVRAKLIKYEFIYSLSDVLRTVHKVDLVGGAEHSSEGGRGEVRQDFIRSQLV
jgi:hypothetical protein